MPTLQSSLQLQAAQLATAEQRAAQLQRQVQQADAQAAEALRDSSNTQRSLTKAQATISSLQQEVDAQQADIAGLHRWSACFAVALQSVGLQLAPSEMGRCCALGRWHCSISLGCVSRCLGLRGDLAGTLLPIKHVNADWQCLCRQLDSARQQLSLQAQQQEQQAASTSDQAAALQQQVSLWQRRAEHMRERAAEERSK